MRNTPATQQDTARSYNEAGWILDFISVKKNVPKVGISHYFSLEKTFGTVAIVISDDGYYCFDKRESGLEYPNLAASFFIG